MAWKDRLRRLDARLAHRTTYRLARDTVKDWKDDDAPRLSAALAYYTLFSIAPLLVIAIAIAGFFFGQEAAREQMLDTAEGLIGEAGRERHAVSSEGQAAQEHAEKTRRGKGARRPRSQ